MKENEFPTGGKTMDTVYVIMSSEHEPCHDAIYGDAPRIFRTRVNAEQRVEHLRSSGYWPDEQPKYWIKEMSVAEAIETAGDYYAIEEKAKR